MANSSTISTETTIGQGGGQSRGQAHAPGRDPLGTCSPHHEAWRSLTQTHAAVSGRLQDALAQAELPPLAWFEMLAAIAAAETQRMKMGELAEALVITRGGLTKLVDRLVKAGLIERTFCQTDRRVSYATLLPAGAELLEEMVPIVSAELELTFAARLSERQADELRATLDTVRGTACTGD
ncbi:MAG TPA: MarR family transcriptional regulator [Solirubrobacterales bacterium]|jgi:DNA-binding MarR family transcriptional regulator|nr:MarR family transcriptional regulator [Solirubrobacterales bacterium]